MGGRGTGIRYIGGRKWVGQRMGWSVVSGWGRGMAVWVEPEHVVV